MNRKKQETKMISLMASKSLRFSHMRNAFVMITVALAAALLTAILMFAVGQEKQTQKELSHRQQVAYHQLTGEQAESLKRDERIAYQITVKSGILSSMGGFDVMPYYVSELSDQIRIGALESGRLPESEEEIVLQAAMLREMGIEPVEGSSVTLTFYDGNTETFIVSGILQGSDTVKQFPVFFSERYAENGSQLKDMPYEVYARLEHADSMGAQECREMMYAIGNDAGIARKYVSPSKAFLDSLSVDTQSVMLWGLVGGVILLACILVIYGVFYLSVIGRIHQFGQLSTIGMTKKQIKKLVSHEGWSLFLRSAPAGIAIGGVAGYLILPDGFDPGNTLLVIALVLAMIYGITMISVRKPANIAAAVSPMEALRYVSQDGMKRAANNRLCRRLTPMGLGILNFSKNRKKAAVTMLSLALGGILFMTAATYMSSFDRESYAKQGYFADAQFHIEYAESAVALSENGISGLQAKTPLDAEIIREIYALDGVERVEEIKSFGVRFDFPERDEYGNNDMVFPMTEKETEDIGGYLEEGSAEYEKLMSGDYVLMAGNDVLQEIYGWRFQAGDRITLHYYDGRETAEKEVVILGILNEQFALDHNGLDGWFLMPELAIGKLVSYDSLNAHLLVSAGEEMETAVGDELEQMLAERPQLEMETLADRRTAYAQSIDQIFGTISGLAVFIMLFSILSMMNTLITNIVTRKQELAMLESIGMGRGQIRRMLLGESLLLVLATVGVTMTIGTLCGYALSNMLYDMGAFYMAFRFPTVFSLAYAAVLLAVPLVITLAVMHSFSGEALVERLRGMEN